MNNKTHSIVFFGTGPVAAKSLELLLSNFTIEAVISKPSKNNHSGPSYVLDVCLKHKIPTLLPSNKDELSEIFKEKTFNSSVGVVIDYGIIISSDVFNSFDKGIINSHFSLLPQWRGADPITYAILSGQKETGVSLMKIVEKLDEGPIIIQESITISNKHTAPSLTEDLIKLSHKLLCEYLPKYLDSNLLLTDQNVISEKSGIKTSYSKKIQKTDGVINWNKDAEVIEREIRAFIGWPQSSCVLNNQKYIITEAAVVNYRIAPGSYEIKDTTLIIGCKDKSLSVQKIKPAGKNDMSISSFLAGYRNKL